MFHRMSSASLATVLTVYLFYFCPTPAVSNDKHSHKHRHTLTNKLTHTSWHTNIHTDWLYLLLGLCLCDKLSSNSNTRSKESLGQFHDRNANEMAGLLGNYSQNIASINCSLQKYKTRATEGKGEVLAGITKNASSKLSLTRDNFSHLLQGLPCNLT